MPPVAMPAKGQVGVCLATSGPGATNLVTGIATAIWIQCPCSYNWSGSTAMVGTDAFQEVDIKRITSPLLNDNYGPRCPRNT